MTLTTLKIHDFMIRSDNGLSIYKKMLEMRVTIEQISQIAKLICEAEKLGLLKECQDLSGYSGLKLIGSLQRIAKFQEMSAAGHYLEIGVHQGLTLISVAASLKGMTAFGIDNFSQFDPDGVNQGIVKERASANNIKNIKLINLDYEDALENLGEHIGNYKVGTYFIDGPHDYRSQLMCLLLAKPFLSERSIIVVDDCNYRHVRQANRDFLLTNPEFKLLFESYTRCHPCNMSDEEEAEARLGWWNGVNIIVRDPENILETMLPNTYRDRTNFENEHLIHASKYAEFAPEIVSFVQNIFSFRLFNAAKSIVKLFRKKKNIEDGVRGRYFSANTYSGQLPQSHFNSKSLDTARTESTPR